jgi:outer membrane receptor protein involved in Fe transport
VKAHVQGGITYRGSAPSSLRTDIALVGTGEHVNPNDFQGRLHSATLVDLYAGLDWPRWNVELFGTNIFDKRIDISRQTACGSCTRALVVPGRPRTIGLRAGMKF